MIIPGQSWRSGLELPIKHQRCSVIDSKVEELNLSEKPKNRKKHEGKNTVKKTSISDRRKLVHSLDLQGLSNREISKQVNISLSTVEKDLSEMRQSIRDWFSELGSEERYVAFVDAVIHIDTVQKQLWKMTRDEKNQKEKAKLLGQITDNAIKKAGLFKTSDSHLTAFYFKQKDISPRELAREEFLDTMS